jgi:hypothetical protein
MAWSNDSTAVSASYCSRPDSTRLDSLTDAEATLLTYLKLYNHHMPQRVIGAKTSIQALKEWKKKPELFVKRVYDQT